MWGNEKNKLVKLEKYFDSLSTSPVELLGGGQFRKCGKFFENWKHRSYFIYSNHGLIYFENNIPKGVLDIQNIYLEEGDMKLLQQAGLKSSSEAIDASPGPSHSQKEVISGYFENNPEEGGVDGKYGGIPMILSLKSDCREKMKIVFETLDEAQKFCLLIRYGSKDHNVEEFIQKKRWLNLFTALDGKVHPPPRLTFLVEIKENEQEIARGFFPMMNSTTKEELHNELSLLQSARQIVLVKLSLLNGVMRKSGITIANPMDLLNETYDVARCHLLRQHYNKKQIYLDGRIAQCTKTLEQLKNIPLETERHDSIEADDLNVEEIVAQAQAIIDAQEKSQEKVPPRPPPPPPRVTKVVDMNLSPNPKPLPPETFNSQSPSPKVLTHQNSTESVPFTSLPPTPVASPQRPVSAVLNRNRDDKIRALWADDDEEDAPKIKEADMDIPPPRPLSLPHRLPSSTPKNSNGGSPDRRASLASRHSKLTIWRQEIDSRLECAYSVMKKIIPRDIHRFLKQIESPSPEALLQQFCYHFGFHPQLGQRILQKKCLWLISFSDSELSRVSPSDLEDQGVYALKGQALDIKELSAVYYRLDPIHKSSNRLFEGDMEEIIHKIRKKLKYYFTQEENGTLPEGLKRHPAYLIKEDLKENAPTPERRRGSLRYEEV